MDSRDDWGDFAREAPELAASVRARFEGARHHVLATLRKDGSPRLSGTEVQFRGAELTVGSMWQARKALDLRRDPRFALQANPGDSGTVGDDARISGVVAEVTDPAEIERYATGGEPPGPFHVFVLKPREVVTTGVDEAAGQLVIRRWRPGEQVREFRRS